MKNYLKVLISSVFICFSSIIVFASDLNDFPCAESSIMLGDIRAVQAACTNGICEALRTSVLAALPKKMLPENFQDCAILYPSQISGSWWSENIGFHFKKYNEDCQLVINESGLLYFNMNAIKQNSYIATGLHNNATDFIEMLKQRCLKNCASNDQELLLQLFFIYQLQLSSKKYKFYWYHTKKNVKVDIGIDLKDSPYQVIFQVMFRKISKNIDPFGQLIDIYPEKQKMEWHGIYHKTDLEKYLRILGDFESIMQDIDRDRFLDIISLTQQEFSKNRLNLINNEHNYKLLSWYFYRIAILEFNNAKCSLNIIGGLLDKLNMMQLDKYQIEQIAIWRTKPFIHEKVIPSLIVSIPIIREEFYDCSDEVRNRFLLYVQKEYRETILCIKNISEPEFNTSMLYLEIFVYIALREKISNPYSLDHLYDSFIQELLRLKLFGKL